ncbi:unnamed protein product [Calicophoron daubneyi]|uniref:EF-hand domain-containing protein n=1 Tax=Calicophoron daubneyi TaxID=300641 RepID=A0AAV2T9T6_CALDB
MESLRAKRENEEYRQAFAVFDLNHDGEIDADELEAVLKQLGMKPTKSEVKAMIRKVDKTNSGTVNIDEFIAMMERRKKYQKSDANLRNAFQFFDRDGDGFITAEELRSIVSKTEREMTVRDVESIIGEVDKDGDGKLNYEGRRLGKVH